MKANICGIYAITGLSNDSDLKYVGSANFKNGIQKRFSNHLTRFRKNKYPYLQLQNIWNEDTKKIKFEVLEQCSEDSTNEYLEEREQFWIDYLSMVDGIEIVNKQKIVKRRKSVSDTSRMKAAQSGIMNGNAKLCHDEIIRIKKLLRDSNLSETKIAEIFKVSISHISNIKNEKMHKDIKID